jgi:hypothetical protein
LAHERDHGRRLVGARRPNREFDGAVYLNLWSDPFALPEAGGTGIVFELAATERKVIEGEPVNLSLLAQCIR